MQIYRFILIYVIRYQYKFENLSPCAELCTLDKIAESLKKVY